MANYFTKDTDDNIRIFIESPDIVEKHFVFDTMIRPAFEKLIENLIYVYGFYTLDDVETLKRDCLTNLYEMLPKFDCDKGTKGFSYFNVVAKNWFIQKTRERNKRVRLESDLHCNIDTTIAKSDPNLILSSFEHNIEQKEFWIAFYREIESWRKKFSKKTELQVLEAVIFLMKNSDRVSIYSKKAVYLYIREMTGLNTKQVIINLKKMKELFVSWKDNWLDTGDSEEEWKSDLANS